MTQPTDQDSRRDRAANLKIIEAKANLWSIASFAAMVAVLAGLVAVIAACFKLVLG